MRMFLFSFYGSLSARVAIFRLEIRPQCFDVGLFNTGHEASFFKGARQALFEAVAAFGAHGWNVVVI